MHIKLSTLALTAAACLLSSPSLVAALSAQDIPPDTPVSNLLQTAATHLAKGETSEALVYFDAAIARDPSNYLTYFKRATTYLSLGRSAQATDDLQQALKLRPGFKGAHQQLSTIRARQAQWDEAREHLLLAGHKPSDPEFAALMNAQGAAELAESAEKQGQWDQCIEHAGAAIVVASRSVPLRELRARCRFARGEMEEGMSDLRHVLQMRPGDVTPHVKMSAVTFYSLADLAGGQAHARRCLQSDPDSKLCRRILKQEKAVEKTLGKVTKSFEGQRWMTGTRLLVPGKEDEPGLIAEVREEVRVLQEDGTIPTTAPKRLLAQLVGLACQGYYELNDKKKAAKHCKEALELDEFSLYGLLQQAREHMDKELYDAAIATLNKAGEHHADQRDKIRPLLQEAQVLLKRSKQKDYYKVLGVSRDADPRQIKAAYRRLSKQHHPDKAGKLGITKEEAEKKMAAINEAYEVLSDPELRARFDRGDDPNSHEGQNPFQQGSPFGFGGMPFHFNPGGGGSQHFQFQFNGFP